MGHVEAASAIAPWLDQQEHEAVFLAALSQTPPEDRNQVLRDLHAIAGIQPPELATD